jgi:hypothetical protein
MLGRMNKIVRTLSIGFILLSPFITAPAVFAASASMYISPSSGSVTAGSNFTISVYEDSGSEPVNAAKVNISYPDNLLDYVSYSNSSAFGIAASSSGGGGTVDLDRGALPAVTGNQLIATITFKATVAGTAPISVTATSKVVSANTNQSILTTRNGTSYTINNQTQPPTPPGGGTSPTPPSSRPSPSPSPTSRSSKGSSSSPGKDTSAPTISGILVTDLGTKSASVTWTTSESSTSEVSYSLSTDANYYITAKDGNLTTTHKIALDSSSLSPATEYHFKVKSVDAAGNAGSSEEQFFTTKGLTMLVTVLDQNKRPVPQAKVTIGDSTGVTNNEGQATINGLKIGKSTATVEYKKSKTVTSLEVMPPTDANFSVAPDVTLSIVKPTSHIIYIVPPIILLALILLFFGSRARRGGGGNDEGVKDLRQFVSSSTVSGSANSSKSSNAPVAVAPPDATNDGPSSIIKPTNTSGQL